MANAVTKVNSIAIANIAKINGQNDSDLAKLNTLEFTGAAPDAHTLISTHDIAVLGASASIDITSGIDSTYDVYEFHFVNIHPQNNGAEWQFQVKRDGGSAFDEYITSTMFRAYIQEDGANAPLQYQDGYDQAQGQAYNQLTDYTGDEDDGSLSGIFTLYAPSSTTYVKHFMATINDMYDAVACAVWHTAGYINAEEAIDEISFEFDNGEIEGGEIRMYGIAKS